MDPKKLFVDERLVGFCSYCGKTSGTRDHDPSRILLDKPHPSNIPVVDSCKECNESFSLDEEYIACLIECVIFGTTNLDSLEREKIKRIFCKRLSLSSRILDSRIEDKENNILWRVEVDRLKKIILKLARGHLAYELNVFHFDEPDFLQYIPLGIMSDEEFLAYNSVSEQNGLLPEIGSRAFIHLWKNSNFEWTHWRIVQEGRYRYCVEQGNGDKVQFVLSEYLACTVIWS